jgi:hypothetical protein
MSVLSLEVSTVKTIWDWDFLISTFLNCRDFLDCRDNFFLSWSRFKKQQLFNKHLAVMRFLSRLFEKLHTLKSWQVEKFWLRKMLTSTNSRSLSRQAVKIYQNFQVSTDFLISMETFFLENLYKTLGFPATQVPPSKEFGQNPKDPPTVG